MDLAYWYQVNFWVIKPGNTLRNNGQVERGKKYQLGKSGIFNTQKTGENSRIGEKRQE